MSQTRQLAAIMFADIAGYTALMETNEVLAMQLRDKLKKNRKSRPVSTAAELLSLAGMALFAALTVQRNMCGPQWRFSSACRKVRKYRSAEI